LNIAAYCGDTGLITVRTEKRREKVVVLRELQRAIIYTRELSKQAIEGHVSTAFIVYSVYKGARLTTKYIVLFRLSLFGNTTH
jgi:shikimate kinase